MRLVPGRVRQHPIQLARPALADGAARAKAQRCGCCLPLRWTAVVFGPTMMPCCPGTVRRVSSRLVPSYKRARSTASSADASPGRWTATTSFDCAERLTSSSAAPRRASLLEENAARSCLNVGDRALTGAQQRLDRLAGLYDAVAACSRSAAAISSLTAMKLSGVTEIESMPACTRKRANDESSLGFCPHSPTLRSWSCAVVMS